MNFIRKNKSAPTISLSTIDNDLKKSLEFLNKNPTKETAVDRYHRIVKVCNEIYEFIMKNKDIAKEMTFVSTDLLARHCSKDRKKVKVNANKETPENMLQTKCVEEVLKDIENAVINAKNGGCNTTEHSDKMEDGLKENPMYLSAGDMAEYAQVNKKVKDNVAGDKKTEDNIYEDVDDILIYDNAGDSIRKHYVPGKLVVDKIVSDWENDYKIVNQPDAVKKLLLQLTSDIDNVERNKIAKQVNSLKDSIIEERDTERKASARKLRDILTVVMAIKILTVAELKKDNPIEKFHDNSFYKLGKSFKSLDSHITYCHDYCVARKIDLSSYFSKVENIIPLFNILHSK